MSPRSLTTYRHWLDSRLPLIGSWLRRRALNELTQDGSAEAVQTLAGAVWRGPDPEGRAAALDALRQLARQDNRAAQEALCRFVIHHDHGPTRAEVLAAGYLPQEESQRALFYFLTGQWEEYEGLDFDHSLLRAVYEAASDPLRRRIAAAAREAGRLEWVGIVSGGRQGRRLGAMTEAEWKATLTVLQDNRRWDEMWRLAQEAPPCWGARLLRRLKDARWTPGKEERREFDDLLRLAVQFPEDDFRFRLHPGATLSGHRDAVRCLAFSPDSRVLASGSADKTVRLWSLPEGRTVKTLEGPKGHVNCLAISPDGRVLASGGKDSSVWLWRLPSAKTSVHLDGHTQMVLCLAITPDSRLLASGSADSGIQLWNLPEGKNRKLLDGHSAGVLDLVISPNGRLLASASGDGSVRLWSLPDGKAMRTLWGHRNEDTDAVSCLAISPDSRLLASGGTDANICLWSLPGGHELETLAGHLAGVSCLAISPNGRVLASGSADQTVRLWRLPDGRPLETWEAHSSEVTRFAVSPDGDILASVCGSGLGHDHSVRLWGLAERRRLQTLDGHTRYVTCVAMSPDGRFLASGSGDTTIRLWTAEMSRLIGLPVRQATLKDLAWVQSALRKDGLPEPEKRALAFLAALIRRRRRYDVEVEEAAPRVIEVGEFDIEIE
jgi:WD40 repeat protein